MLSTMPSGGRVVHQLMLLVVFSGGRIMHQLMLLAIIFCCSC